uniref:Beta-defensin-like domain-containing protein n=1 Tax=Zosterops lateralis melanops TaxID=1220523 RepID=A0A8D2QNL6_ZOSLA
PCLLTLAFLSQQHRAQQPWLPPVRASAQDCERRGGFCSQRSCPSQTKVIGRCSAVSVCCKR